MGDVSEMELYQNMLALQRDRDDAIRKRFAAGEQAAQDIVAYKVAKARRALEMRAEKVPVTLIQTTVDGDDEVAPFLLEKLTSEASMQAWDEAIHARMQDIKILAATLESESHMTGNY